MQAARLMAMVLLLETRGQVTAAGMARHFEVSERTIGRDMDALSAAGVPVYAVRGSHGGYRLAPGYRMRPSALEADEAAALLFAGLPGVAERLGLGPGVDGARLKFLAGLGPAQRARVSVVRERFHLDAPGWLATDERPAFLPEVAEAVWRSRALRVRYMRWTGEVERELEPLGLVYKGGAWYVVAAVGGQARTYRLTRMIALEALDRTFERPPDFDLAGYWRQWTADFARRMARVTVAVRLHPTARHHLAMALGERSAAEALSHAGAPDADGRVTVHLSFEGTEHAARLLLQFAGEAEVLDPPAVRERLRQLAAETIARYSAVPSVAPW